jgi:hypothetical protein
VGGIALQVLGGLIAYWSLTGQLGSAEHVVNHAFVGGIIAVLGLWALRIGVVMRGVALALAEAAGDRAEPSTLHMPLAPAQDDPARVATDPAPFTAHAEDSQVVADVRRALLLARRPSAVSRIVAKAAQEGRLSDNDRAMVDALVADRQRRATGPLPPQF